MEQEREYVMYAEFNRSVATVVVPYTTMHMHKGRMLLDLFNHFMGGSDNTAGKLLRRLQRDEHRRNTFQWVAELTHVFSMYADVMTYKFGACPLRTHVRRAYARTAKRTASRCAVTAPPAYT
ncbi:MAG: hypothetical protein EOO41_01975 [Methanobacteriota archaeon]|nr:MAG: hypothetical protein EOO41_01975 [Euryarchaeota archaeon]